jgi:hypothetical protein
MSETKVKIEQIETIPQIKTSHKFESAKIEQKVPSDCELIDGKTMYEGGKCNHFACCQYQCDCGRIATVNMLVEKHPSNVCQNCRKPNPFLRYYRGPAAPFDPRSEQIKGEQSKDQGEIVNDKDLWTCEMATKGAIYNWTQLPYYRQSVYPPTFYWQDSLPSLSYSLNSSLVSRKKLV